MLYSLINGNFFIFKTEKVIHASIANTFILNMTNMFENYIIQFFCSTKFNMRKIHEMAIDDLETQK